MSPTRPNHQIETVPPRSRPLLYRIKSELGYIPGTLARMAESPAALEGLVALRDSCAKSAFSEDEQRVIALTAQHAAGIPITAVADTDRARVCGLSDRCIDQICKDSTMDSPRLNALRDFVVRVVERQGHVDPAQLGELLCSGFTHSHVFELIMMVMGELAVIYTNRVIGEEPDPAFLTSDRPQVA